MCVNGGMKRLAEALKKSEELKKKLAQNETALPPATTTPAPIPAPPTQHELHRLKHALAQPNKTTSTGPC